MAPTGARQSPRRKQIETHMTDANDKLTITLTNRAPVTITKAKWPVIASAKDWNGEYESQANRFWRITVREHAGDGRILVYASFTSHWANESGHRAGELLLQNEEPTYDYLAPVIRRVTHACGAADRLADECIADLPPVDLDAEPPKADTVLREYLVVRHGANTANQHMRDRRPVTIVEAASIEAATRTVRPLPLSLYEAAYLELDPTVDVWANQHLSAVPLAEADPADVSELRDDAALRHS